MEELAESNEKFLTQVEGFREQVVEQGKQLKQLRGWVAWERDGLAELRRLKEEREVCRAHRRPRTADRRLQARHKSMLALQVQLKLHAGFMQSMREQSYSALDDAFDDEVRPALLKRLSKAGGIEGEIGVLREALEAEAKRVAYERKCVQRLHKDAIKAGKSGAKTKDAAKDTKDAKDKASAGSAVAKKKKEAKKEEVGKRKTCFFPLKNVYFRNQRWLKSQRRKKRNRKRFVFEFWQIFNFCYFVRKQTKKIRKRKRKNQKK